VHENAMKRQKALKAEKESSALKRQKSLKAEKASPKSSKFLKSNDNPIAQTTYGSSEESRSQKYGK